MIKVSNLRFEYPGGGALLAVDALTVGVGERIALVGPSGVGKTTLVRLLSGILSPTAGQLSVDGTDLTTLNDAARRRFRLRRVGLVFQRFELLDHLTVRENVLLPYLLDPAQRVGRTERARADRLLDQVGLAQIGRRHPNALSQGERQRVAVCRACLTSPRLLIADEPTGSLDAHASAQIMDLLEARAADLGATLLVVTHDPAVMGRCTRQVALT